MDVSDLDFSTPDASFDSFFELVDRWFGPIQPEWGYTNGELGDVELPRPVERWLSTLGRAPSGINFVYAGVNTPDQVRLENMVDADSSVLGQLVMIAQAHGMNEYAVNTADTSSPNPQIYDRNTADGVPHAPADITLKELLVTIGFDNLLLRSHPLPADPGFDSWWQRQLAKQPEPLIKLNYPDETEAKHYFIFDDVIGRWDPEYGTWHHQAATLERKQQWERVHGPAPISAVTVRTGPHRGESGTWGIYVNSDGSARLSIPPGRITLHLSAGSVDFGEFTQLAEHAVAHAAENGITDGTHGVGFFRQGERGARVQPVLPAAIVTIFNTLTEAQGPSLELEEALKINLPIAFDSAR